MTSLYRYAGKRALDAFLSGVSLAVLSPLLGVVAFAVRLDSPGPVFFVQERLGRHGCVFKVFKFRTMTDRPRVTTGEIVGRGLGVTRVGYWLRRLKVDELPQLLNVVRGDMSLVGPRPALPAHIREYDERSRRRLEVRPGLTGLAQVNGNIHLSWVDRWVYDVQYVESYSFGLDVSIILRTLLVVVRGEEASLQVPRNSSESSPS